MGNLQFIDVSTQKEEVEDCSNISIIIYFMHYNISISWPVLVFGHQIVVADQFFTDFTVRYHVK